MSSKLSVKTKGKDMRPKSSDRLKKKPDENPQKSITPSQEAEERAGSSRHVIWNEEIEQLQIKQDELKKVHIPRPPPGEKKTVIKKVAVKKIKKDAENEKIQDLRESIVDEINPKDISGYAGPRYDEKGDVIPYSILGKYEDYYKEAVKRGDLLESLPVPKKSDKVDNPTVKYEKTKKSIQKLNHDEHNALKNWNIKMNERKRQQEHIAKILNKPLEELAMNQADNFRAIQEQRDLIDRTIPLIDYGKGYRVGSEFWNQQRQLGDDLHGLHMTLTQTQKGQPSPVEHVGLSQLVKNEKGCEWHGKTNINFRYPWHKSEFLNHRLQQLQPYIDELNPWQPDFESLQVVGSNQPYEQSGEQIKIENEPAEAGPEEKEMVEEDIKENKEPIREIKPTDQMFGPSLFIDGQLAPWTGSGNSHVNEIALETRVSFEGFTEERITSHLPVLNNGTTTIYFDWTKLSKSNPFDLNQRPVQRFYFNNAPGVILPGETVHFPFVFKSPTPGVYTEQWRLETRPIVCGGAAIVVTLRGVSVFEDKFKEQREKLERDLSERQAKEICSRLLYGLIDNIRTPQRSPSPIDAYVTEEELFIRNNPGFQYEHQKISQLKDLYAQLFPEEERAENVWSLSIEDLKESIMELDEDDERKDPLLQQLNEIMAKLTYIIPKPLQLQMQNIGYQIFLEAVDRMVGESLLLRQTMGLPMKNMEDLEFIGQTSESNMDPIIEEIHIPSPDDGRKGNKAKPGSQSKALAKDARPSKTPPAKPDAKGKSGGPSPGPVPKKTPPPVKTPQAAAVQAAPVEVPADQSSQETANILVLEEELSPLEKLYKSTFTVQVYDILGDMADKMDEMFSSLKQGHESFIY